MSRIKKMWILWGSVLVALVLFCYIQNNLLTVSRYRYHNEKITESLDGYTIVQISDLHNKLFGAGQERLLKKIRDCEPDMIVITGDLVDNSRSGMENAMTFVIGAVQIAPVYYVTGNHELVLEEQDLEELLARMREAGVVLLDDDWTRISVGNDSFCLMGLKDSSLGGNTLKKLCEAAREEGDQTTVLLAHEPHFLEHYSKQNIDLVLSGHAHGGQFRIPFVGGFIAPGQGLFPKYTAGSYQEGKTVMVVSRGIGNSLIPLRLFNYPDIVCIRFSAE